jgi:hypothetical protein
MMVGEVERDVYRKVKVDCPWGVVKVKEQARLQVGCLKIVHAHL